MENHKELREQYKNRKMTGGVYRILNTENQRYFLAATNDLAGSNNRHNFAVSTNLCIIPAMKEDWKCYGSTAFVFESLEELEKKPEQTTQKFAEDLETLKEMWQEKFAASLSY